MSRFAAQYPEGSIQKQSEIIQLLHDLKDEIHLWAVEQSGSLSGYVITPASKFVVNNQNDPDNLCFGPDFNRVSCFKTYGLEREQWFWYYFLMGSYNIGNQESNGFGVHRLFIDRDLALRYSEELKNDLEYIEEVQQHHKLCDKFDGVLDYLED